MAQFRTGRSPLELPITGNIGVTSNHSDPRAYVYCTTSGGDLEVGIFLMKKHQKHVVVWSTGVRIVTNTRIAGEV